jgi:hypothetical protein
MRNRILFLFFVLLLSVFASAQGGVTTSSPVSVNQFGVPLASTTVSVCSNNTCGSLAPLYTDNTLTVACSGAAGSQPLNNLSNPTVGSGCSNPGLTDSLGNVVAFAAAGMYWCQYSGSTIPTKILPCPVVGPTSTSTPGTPTGALQGNNAGTFAGVPNSTVNFTSGAISFNASITFNAVPLIPSFVPGNNIGVTSTGQLQQRPNEFNSHDFTVSGTVAFSTLLNACPATPTTCFIHLNAGDLITVSSTVTIGGGTTQAVYVTDEGANIQCSITNGTTCIEINDWGVLRCAGYQAPNSANGCAISSTANNWMQCMVSNAGFTGLNQTNFEFEGFQFLPGSGTTFSEAQLCAIAVEGAGRITGNGFLSVGHSPDIHLAPGPISGGLNNITVEHNKFYGNGNTGPVVIASGGAGTQGAIAGFSLMHNNYGDGLPGGCYTAGSQAFGSSTPAGCLIDFDGSAAYVTGTVTMSSGASGGCSSNCVTATSSSFFYATALTGAGSWLNQWINLNGKWYQIEAMYDSSHLQVSATITGTTTGVAFAAILPNASGASNPFITGTFADTLYIEGSTSQTSAMNYIEAVNVASFHLFNFIPNQGPQANACLYINHSGPDEGVIFVDGRSLGGQHCTYWVENLITGNNISAAEGDLAPYIYTGDHSSSGFYVDGNTTTTTLVVTSLGSSASPVCPNGTNNALTTSGCSGNGATMTLTNNTGGTTVSTLTEIVNSGGNGTGLIFPTTGTAGIAGICISNCGTSGTATIQTSGLVNCVFDGTTTAADYVIASVTTAGECHDSGSASTSNGASVIGRVLSSNVGGGTYQIDLFAQETRGFQFATPSSGCSTTTTCTVAVTWPQTWSSTAYHVICQSVGFTGDGGLLYPSGLTTTGFTLNFQSAEGTSGFTGAYCEGRYNN